MADYQGGNLFNKWNYLTKSFTTTDCTPAMFSKSGEEYNIITQPLSTIEAYIEAYHNSFWSVNEVNFNNDSNIIKKMQGLPIYNQLKRILAFFTIVEGPIAENLATFQSVNSPHVQCLFLRQQLQEIEHAKVYTKMLKSGYVLTMDELQAEVATHIEVPSVQNKMQWMSDGMGVEQPLLIRLANAAFAEGIFFQASFACIMYLKTTGHYPFDTLYDANQYVLRDESLHCDMFTWLFKELYLASTVDLSEYDTTIRENFERFLELELEFANDVLYNENDFAGLDKKLLIEYIKYTANRTFANLYDLEFTEDNPLSFMGYEKLAPMINMFEKRGINYISQPPPIYFDMISFD